MSVVSFLRYGNSHVFFVSIEVVEELFFPLRQTGDFLIHKTASPVINRDNSAVLSDVGKMQRSIIADQTLIFRSISSEQEQILTTDKLSYFQNRRLISEEESLSIEKLSNIFFCRSVILDMNFIK